RRHTRFDCDWSSDVCSSDLEGDATPELVGSVRHEVPRGRQDLAAAEARVDEHAAEHDRADRMQAELERRDDAEVAAAAADAPERSEERRVGNAASARAGSYQ